MSNKLNTLQETHVNLSEVKLEYFKLQISEYEDLIGPEMDQAEMFFVDTQLDELLRKTVWAEINPISAQIRVNLHCAPKKQNL